jgi:hypothetical protein
MSWRQLRPRICYKRLVMAMRPSNFRLPWTDDWGVGAVGCLLLGLDRQQEWWLHVCTISLSEVRQGVKLIMNWHVSLCVFSLTPVQHILVNSSTSTTFPFS